jgi:mono/diheme cytochrome c family protein
MTSTSLPKPATSAPPPARGEAASPVPARIALVALAALAAFGCRFEPDTPELRHGLNANILESPDPAFELYADSRVAQAQLRGLLEMLVGTPSAPGFFRTEGMIDAEFDPNWQGGDLEEAQWEAIVADNTERFADELAAIEAGDFDAVRLPREALDLRRWWAADSGVLADLEADLAAARSGATDEDGEPLDAAAIQAELDEHVGFLQEQWPVYLTEYYPTLRESAEMYRTQCMHCHGVSGGGDGTTAPYLNPRPRDYRKGIFKFTSVADKAKPTRADVFRILGEGIYTTAMPSFRRFSDAQLHGLVDYVRLLAIRGRVEELVALDYDPDEGGIQQESVFAAYDDEWAAWLEAPEHLIVYAGDVPEPTPELIAHGKDLFFQAESANCASCHGNDARGNGPSAKQEIDGETVPITDDWGNDIVPRDLTRGVYRFGRRPIDLFRRMHAGINGTPMPAQTTLLKPDGSRILTDEDLWAIVHYVRSLATHVPRGDDPERAAVPGVERANEGGGH